jgi:phosphoserine phosphatase
MNNQNNTPLNITEPNVLYTFDEALQYNRTKQTQPTNTKESIQWVNKKGHKVFISSGHTRGK